MYINFTSNIDVLKPVECYNCTQYYCRRSDTDSSASMVEAVVIGNISKRIFTHQITFCINKL